MKALITGGAGFAGSHLAEQLLEQGEEVVALVRAEDPLANLEHLLPRVRVVQADILDLDRVRAVMEEIRPQRIYHLAALSSPAESFRDPRLTYQVNFTGTLNLLLAWRQAALESRFLLVSSSQVYGQVSQQDLPVRESTPLRPANPYAGSKAASEMLAVQFFESYGLPIVRARPFNHAGPRQDASFVCSSLARQVAEIELGRRPPVIRAGLLKVSRDFSDVRDIVCGYRLLLERGQPGEVYQLCSGQPVSVEAILNRLIALASQRVEVVVDESRLRSQEEVAMWGDPSKATNALGWKPRFELQVTLQDLKEYWERVLRNTQRELGQPSSVGILPTDVKHR